MAVSRIASTCLLAALAAPVITPAAENSLAGARELLLRGKYAEAAELYGPLAERGDPVAVLGLARCLSAEGRLDEAVGKLTAAAGGHARLHAELARLAFEQGDTREAKARADVDDPTVRRKLAQLALDRGAHAEAADWANQALRIDVMDAEVHRLFAEALLGSHNYAEAIEEFEIAVELEPTQLPQRLALAEACTRARQPAKARRVVEALLELAPDYPGTQALIESLEETDPL